MIKFDSATGSGYQTGTNNLGWDHAVVNHKYPGMIVGVALFGAGIVNSVTGIVTNDIYPTILKDFKLIRVDSSGLYRSEIWGLTTAFDLNVEAFTVTIQVGLSASITAIGQSACYSYFGGVGVHTGAAGSGAQAEASIVTTGNNSIAFGNLVTQDAGAITEPGEQTNRYGDSGALGSIRGSDQGPLEVATSDGTISYSDIGALDLFAISVVELLSLTQSPPAIGI